MYVILFWIYRLRGWRFSGEGAGVPRFVMIGAPHTSNWDFPVFLAAVHHLGLKPRFIGKSSLFWPPLGWLMRALGGIPVDRDSPGGFVDQAVAESSKKGGMLAIAPEGTRSYTEQWKSGFYRIARTLEVPVVCAVGDFSNRTVTFSGPIHLTGDRRVDMDRIRAEFQGAAGKFPDKVGPIRLNHEDRNDGAN